MCWKYISECWQRLYFTFILGRLTLIIMCFRLLLVEDMKRKPYLVFFNKSNKRCSFDFHRLSLPVVQSQNEVEEVGFPKV